jgi:hypothetical protein
MKFALTFIRPEYETPIAVSGDTLSELSDKIDETIEKRAHDVYISAAKDANQDELEEIASMLLIKGHFLRQNKYCPRIDIFANVKGEDILDSQDFYVSSLHPNILDILFNAFYGGNRLTTMFNHTIRFQYVYFDPKSKKKWTREVGYKIEEHFNKRLKELKNKEAE